MMDCRGIWYCYQCKGKTRFYVTEGTRDPDYCECGECGYQYGKSINMNAANQGERVKATLPQSVVEEGFRLYMEEEKKFRMNNGIPGHIPNEIRAEMGRRAHD